MGREQDLEERNALLLSDSRQSGSPSLPIFYVCVLGVSFFFAFTAYSGTQNLESSIDLGHVSGTTALGILYIVFTMSCLVGPRVVGSF